jgi:hypothetical protein
MNSPCIEWTGAFNPVRGYGQTRLPGATSTTTAHRAAWIKAFGPIAPGLHVAHACDNRRCINLAHLFLATARENNHDMIAKGRARIIGEHNGNARLRAVDVATIRQSRETTRCLAARYGLTSRYIRKIRAGERWQHSPGLSGN